MTIEQSKLKMIEISERFGYIGKFPVPICEQCKNCQALKRKNGGVFEIDCIMNPNLGGVRATYQKCRHFEVIH